MIKKSNYPEIEALTRWVELHACNCQVTAQTPVYKWLVPVVFTIREQRFSLLIEDEYDDLKHPNNLLHVELVLRFLEVVGDSSDYLSWCNELMLEPSTQGLLDYFRELVASYDQIAELTKTNPLRSFVSGLDFELNAGAAQHLRTQKD